MNADPTKSLAEIRNQDASDMVYSFFEMDAFGAAIKESGFSQAERVKHIVEVIRSPDAADKLNGLKEFRAVAKEVLEVNGAIANASQEQSDGDITKRLTAQRLVRRLSTKNQESPRGESPIFDGTQSHLPPPSSPPVLNPAQETGGGNRLEASGEADTRRDHSGPQRLD